MKHLSILVIDEQSTPGTVACIVGAYEIFTKADAFWQQMGHTPKFKIQLVGSSNTAALTKGLFYVQPHIAAPDVGKTDLVIIPSSLVREYELASAGNQMLIDWVEKQHRLGAEVASMCTGVFMLASTGLLNGKICSTHWSVSEKFNSLFPQVKLQTDKLITDENGIYTNGGAYSFLHLMVYLVEKHYDRQTSIYCAKMFQIDLDRNMQAEFSIFSGQKKHHDDVVQQAQAFIESNYRQKVSIMNLSDKFSVSRRNFDRRFIKATGLTPLDYLQRVKIEAAKRAFENTRKTVNEVMYDVGYQDNKAFREVFGRITGMSPVEYKVKYNGEA